MSQLFPPAANALLTFVAVTIVTAFFLFWPLRSVVQGSAYVTAVGVPIEQPVPFSHKHHVGDIGIHCEYCHTGVEKSAFAGLPPTETCMGCHTKIWKDAPVLDPVRSSYATGEPIKWNRVTRIPDYVYFNHSIHVKNGVGCESCHGRVDSMPLTQRVLSFAMQQCLECHRHPEKYIRPQTEIFTMGWADRKGNEEDAAHGAELVKALNIQSKRLTDCVVCHR